MNDRLARRSTRYRLEIDGLLAGDGGPREIRRALVGPRRLWWRCCREAVADDPEWLFRDGADAVVDQIGAWSAIRDGEREPMAEAAAATLAVARAIRAEDRDSTTRFVREAGQRWERVHAVPPSLAGGGFMTGRRLRSTSPALADQVESVIRCARETTAAHLAALVGLTALLLTSASDEQRGVARIQVVFGRRGSADGVTGTLELRDLQGGPPGLFPDPRFMGVVEADAAFWESSYNAWRLAGRRRETKCVLWRLLLHDGSAAPSIEGTSLGAAFAVALRELFRAPARMSVVGSVHRFFRGIRPDRALTGGVGPSGGLTRVGHMSEKMAAAAARGLRLIAPEDNRSDHARAQRPEKVEFARTVRQADALVRRWRVGRTLTAVAVVLATGGSGIGAYAYATHAAAQEELSRTAAAHARKLLDGQPNLARQLAVAAYRISPTPEAFGAVIEASMAGGEVTLPAKVHAVRFRPGTTDMVIASADGIYTADPDGHAISRTNPSIDGDITDVSLSRDGRLMAAASADGTVQLWSMRDLPHLAPRGLVRYPGHLATSVVFSDDLRYLAASFAPARLLQQTGDYAVRVWDLTAGEPFTETWQQFLVDQPGPASLRFTPRGLLLIGGTRLYAVDTQDSFRRREIVTPRNAAANGLYSIAPMSVSPDGAILATVDTQLGLLLWDIGTPGQEQYYQPREYSLGAAFAPAGNTMVTWDAERRETVLARIQPMLIGARRSFTFERLPSCIRAPRVTAGVFVFSTDNRYLATPAESTVRFWKIDPLCPAQVAVMPGSVEAMAADGAGRRTATIDTSGSVQLWVVNDVGPPTLLSTAPRSDRAVSDNGVASIAMSPSGAVVVSAGRDDWIQVWDVNGDALVLRNELSNRTAAVGDVAISPDGRWLAMANGTLTLFDLSTPRPLANPVTLATGDRGMARVVFDPSGLRLAGASTHGQLQIWDLGGKSPTRQHLLRIPADTTGLAFRTDGLSIAIAGAALTVWDLSMGDDPAATTYPNVTGTELLHSPDGRHLLTVDTEGVYIWDFRGATPTDVARLPGSTIGPMRAVGTTRLIALPGSLWSYDPERFIAHICQTTGDLITAEQWNAYLPSESYNPACR